ncbi:MULTISPECIES: glutamate racemase [unclassified Campylobacter]|uniref:glutamate racemase n=1 Tax=unclassified Campylobacter TaxID=2593542 RepID=UPI0012382013|nr:MULTISPECIES: glutamate racemase [unclassified Campylobacter]KAA6225096.1 glutamate racemase [Campylobacter sp. LR196d]KAA6226110.1 glutamate racemase [Campylobacter sp. LR185c]KAA6228057.1 glutamate racemase [Campylobacter sp. LR286c]KAA6231522.1 glutamate racemase [Campylobacter sp. LR291e]KAA8604609.1 glutamate racemase [Campylobacter sp. LR185c]
MRIGVFDSGVGGLSVLKSLYEARLFDEIIYYGDTARVPYGVKDKDTIIKFCLEALEFFNKFNIEMLIIACNTASAYALNALQDRANFSVYGVIDAGVWATKKVISDKNKEILVIATKATINSKEYQKRLKKEGFNNIKALATGLFVPMVEDGIFSGELLQSAFNYYFKDIKSPDALILACTHFPLLSKSLQEYFGKKTRLIHSGEAIVEFLKTHNNLQSLKYKARLEFYASSDIKSLKNTAKIWLN